MKSCINGATTMPYTLEQDIVEASKAGFEGLEIWWDKLQKYLENNSVEDLRELLSESNIEPVAICPLLIWPFRDTEPARIAFKEAVNLAPKIGCTTLIACPDFQPARMTRDEAMAIHAKELTSLAEIAAENNLRLAIEPIGGHTLVPGPTEALELIKLAGSPTNVGIMMDTFHYFRSQVSDEEITAIPVDKLYIVHVNDCEDIPLNELTDANRLYPLLGVIPLVKKLSILQNIGYQGYLSVEIFRPEYWEKPINEIVTNSFDRLEELLGNLK